MQKWHHFFHKNTGLSPYVWVVFYILPFYFIFHGSSPYQVGVGIAMILMFFLCYVLAFLSRGWLVYFWTSVQIMISITMTLMFGYVYFSLFLAFFIGNLQHRIAFFTLYSIHLVSTLFAVNYGFVTHNPFLVTQFPFVILSMIAVILLPVNTYNKNKSDKLQEQLEDANKRISELVKLEERQRIARDLHDTLGQKLSLIGLKSDLAGKLVPHKPEQALEEMRDIRQTARTALKEVREMVTQMRGTRIEDELFRIEQMLRAAEIEYKQSGDPASINISLIAENVVSMCLKEAVTNIVKHSGASSCTVLLEPTRSGLTITVKDNGVGLTERAVARRGNGLRGMKERLEFVNGTLELVSDEGTTLIIKVPYVSTQAAAEEAKG